ncbi:MAG: ROK family protein [Sphingobacterium sp.]
MTLYQFLSRKPESSLNGVKWYTLKRSIVNFLLSQDDATILDMSNQLRSSIPTVTKAVNELLADELIIESGKNVNTGGRRSALYAVATDKTYFLGVEATRSGTSFGIQNLKDEFVTIELNKPFVLQNSYESLIEFCEHINQFVQDSQLGPYIVGACVNLSGRVNSQEGYSHNYFFNENRPLTELVAEQIHMPVYIEKDSRAMTRGEYTCGVVEGEKNVIFLNYSWGMGLGILCEDTFVYGKSGYSGELGHSPVFENELLCHCGKVGCLETEVSGWALVNQFEKARGEGRTSGVSLQKDSSAVLKYQQILSEALHKEDSLCIELITEQCEKVGRALASLVNILNPELVVIGGDFSQLGDFVLLPIQTSIKKYSLGLVNRDMTIKKSTLGRRAGVTGACRVVREKIISPLEETL